jgi:hypothetical protein
VSHVPALPGIYLIGHTINEIGLPVTHVFVYAGKTALLPRDMIIWNRFQGNVNGTRTYFVSEGPTGWFFNTKEFLWVCRTDIPKDYWKDFDYHPDFERLYADGFAVRCDSMEDGKVACQRHFENRNS